MKPFSPDYMTPIDQCKFIRTLWEQYQDCMEGTNAEEFVHWDNLANAAFVIMKAMEEELVKKENEE